MCLSDWKCEENRNCGTDTDNPTQPTCKFNYKNPNSVDISIPDNSVEGCFLWAERECNADTIAFINGNSCHGYMNGCPYEETDSLGGETTHFCKKYRNINCLETLYKRTLYTS